MIERPADFLLSAEAIKKDVVAFDLRMRHLDSYRLLGAEVRSAKDSGRTATRDNSVNAVVIELVAEIDEASLGAKHQRDIRRVSLTHFQPAKAPSAGALSQD